MQVKKKGQKCSRSYFGLGLVWFRRKTHTHEVKLRVPYELKTKLFLVFSFFFFVEIVFFFNLTFIYGNRPDVVSTIIPHTARETWTRKESITRDQHIGGGGVDKNSFPFPVFFFCFFFFVVWKEEEKKNKFRIHINKRRRNRSYTIDDDATSHNRTNVRGSTIKLRRTNKRKTQLDGGSSYTWWISSLTCQFAYP